MQLPIYFNAALKATAALASGSLQTGQTKQYGMVHSVLLTNLDAAVEYLQLFDAAAAADVTVGSTTPTAVISAAASLPMNVTHLGLKFRKGIVVAATTTATGNTAGSNGMVVSIIFD